MHEENDDISTTGIPRVILSVDFSHRKHTILLSRERENKETKRWIVYLCLLTLLLSYLMRSCGENRHLQVLRNTVGLNSYLGLFALCNFWFTYNLWQVIVETELRKADRTAGVNCNIFSNISSGTAWLLQGKFTTEKRRYSLDNKVKSLYGISIKSGPLKITDKWQDNRNRNQ